MQRNDFNQHFGSIEKLFLHQNNIKNMQNYTNQILVPIDFSEQSLIALSQSYNIAKFHNCAITLLHVIDEDLMDKFKSLFNGCYRNFVQTFTFIFKHNGFNT